MDTSHVIIDGIEKGICHKIVFEGTHDECRVWIYDKSFDYQILERNQLNSIKNLNIL